MTNKNVFLCFICIISAIGGLLFGYDTVVIGATINLIKTQFSISPAMEGWFVSSALAGCLIGVMIAGGFSDKFGRKPSMFLSALALIISSIWCGYAGNIEQLIIARIIGGIGVGLASIVSPLYISEISPAHLRGRMVSLFQFSICVGICAAMFVNSQIVALASRAQWEGHFHKIFTQESWRGMFLGELIPASLFFLLCIIIPESPRWLAKENMIDKARLILSKIRTPQETQQELSEINNAVSHETSSIMQLVAPHMRKVLFIGMFLAIFSELSGITVVMYYGPSLLENAGLSQTGALGGHMCIGIALTVFTMLSIWLVDILGRRLLLFIGNTGCFISLLMIGLLFQIGHSENALITSLAILFASMDINTDMMLVIMMCLFVASFAFSLGPIKWIVISEIFPTKIRGRAVAICTMALWLTDVCLNQFFPIVQSKYGASVSFFTFAIFLVPQFIFIIKIMPETKGKSLEEIESNWERISQAS